MMQILDTETAEPKLRMVLDKAKELGDEGLAVFGHGLEGKNPWVVSECWTYVGEYGPSATMHLPVMIKKLAQFSTRYPLFGTEKFRKEVLEVLEKERGAPLEAGAKSQEMLDARRAMDAVIQVGQHNLPMMESLLAQVSPPSIGDGESIVHRTWARLAKIDTWAADKVMVERWSDAKDGERLMLVIGSWRKDLASAPVIDRLVASLASSSSDIRQVAVSVLADADRFDVKANAIKVRTLLSDKSAWTRLRAARLASFAREVAGPREFVRLLEHESDDIVDEAAMWIGIMARVDRARPDPKFPLPEGALAALVKIATSERVERARISAIVAIGSFGAGGASALDALKPIALGNGPLAKAAKDAVQSIQPSGK